LSPLPEPEVESFFFRLESMVLRVCCLFCTCYLLCTFACGEFKTS
jgi:hypothetical protein